MLLVVAYIVLTVHTCLGEVRYDGNQVRRIIPTHSAQLEILRDLEKNAHTLELDFWTPPTGLRKPVFLQISPTYLSKILAVFELYNITSVVTIPNVQAEIDRERKELSKPTNAFDLGRYYTLAEINRWMNRLIFRYPRLVRLYSAGASYEGRVIRGVRISSSFRNDTDVVKPIFWFYGGVHAREWIGPATVIYLIEQLLARYKEDANVAKVVDHFDWFIVPVANVDGYEYSWTTDRLWRKTRSKSEGTGCFGADPNRNFDNHWCEEGGTSRDPCNDNYCGPNAFSEIEIRSMVDFMKPRAFRLAAFIDFHSFHQAWMTPWGYTTDLPDDYTLQDQSSVVAVTALRSLYDTKYQHGNLAGTLYTASGCSLDYMYATFKTKYSYGVELRDTGKYGFLLPSYEIIPSGKETFRGLVALAEFIRQN